MPQVMDTTGFSDPASMATSGQPSSSTAAGQDKSFGAPQGDRSRARERIQDLANEKNEYKTQRDEALRLLQGMQQTTQGLDRKSTRLNSSHIQKSRMPSSA